MKSFNLQCTIIKHKGAKPLCFIALTMVCSFAYAFDISEFGDFSSRSIIESKIYNKDIISQDKKDELAQRKLMPTTSCLIGQIKKGNYENVKLLLEAKVNPNQSYMSEYPIYIAAKENQFEILKLLYDNNAKLDRGFFSELYESLKNNNTEMAQYLLDKGSRIDYVDSVTNDTILYMALKNKMYDIASQIIAKGASPDMKSVKYIKKHKLQRLIPQQI